MSDLAVAIAVIRWLCFFIIALGASCALVYGLARWAPDFLDRCDRTLFPDRNDDLSS